jgi:hypothetical protein
MKLVRIQPIYFLVTVSLAEELRSSDILHVSHTSVCLPITEIFISVTICETYKYEAPKFTHPPTISSPLCPNIFLKYFSSNTLYQCYSLILRGCYIRTQNKRWHFILAFPLFQFKSNGNKHTA